MKPTLFILAAGMGSRYGGLKQLDGLGPSGETIMDYSVYDAIKAGFGKIVFVIRHDFEQEFRDKVVSKYEDKIPVEVVFQELDRLPEGFAPVEGRTKPWGTGHAVLMAKDVIKEPFAVINADDYYGPDTFRILGEALREMDGKEDEYCMVGFRIGNTLFENGGVSRGHCSVSPEGHLTGVTERHNIRREADGRIIYEQPDGACGEIPEDASVSMNVWGFTPGYFKYSEKFFVDFLKGNKDPMKGEFYIPTVVNNLIADGTITLKVMQTPSKWFGVTYAADRETTVEEFARLVKEGVYPAKLF
ncbi:MAG: nucleotidyltransferase [Muribaculaceae bacterium]|nr:nucleotidyltransferase [Muribaculaceae bacterium]